MTNLKHPVRAPGADSEPRRAGRGEWTALAVLMLPLLLVSMDVSILYYAVPAISRDLAPSSTQQLWILDMYGFVLAGLLITMGAVGDRTGRRRLLVTGAALFGAASLAAAYAHGPGALIAARALLGVGGACLLPSTLALIRSLFDDPGQRAKAVGVWTTVMATGISLGPVVSGALLEHFWWGSVFLINLPAMALLLVLAPLLLPESAPSRSGGRVDAPSALLSLAALLPLIHGVKELAKEGTELSPALAVATGLVLAALFVRRQRRIAHPMVDIDLLRQRAYGASVLANLLAMAATVGFAVFFTQYLQSVLGMGPLKAALWSLVPATGPMTAAPVGAALAKRFPHSHVMGGGFLVSAAGFCWLTQLRTDSPLWLALAASTVYASGLVTAMMLANELAMGAAPKERAGSAAAVLESGQELGGALGMAILGSVGAAVYGRDMAHAPQEAGETLGGALSTAARLPHHAAAELLTTARAAFTHGMAYTAAGAAVLMTGAAVLSVVLLKGVAPGGRLFVDGRELQVLPDDTP